MSVVDNELTNEFMILINNAEIRQATYRDMAWKALADNGNDETAAASDLADKLKDRFEWMVDDINLRPTRRFPRLPGQVKGREDDPAEERKVMVQALILHAFGQVNWLGFARDILGDLKETIRWKRENGEDD